MVKNIGHLSSLNSLVKNPLAKEAKREANIILSTKKLQMKNLLNYQIVTLNLITYSSLINNSNPILRKSLSYINLKTILPLNHLLKIMIVFHNLFKSNNKRSFLKTPILI